MELVVPDHRPPLAVWVAALLRPKKRASLVFVPNQLHPVNTLARPDDVVGGIGLQRLAAAGLHAAIGVELIQTDREQLHHLARVVLVGHAARRGVLLLVVQVREVHAHHRMQRDVLQQVAEVAECAARERVQVPGHAARVDRHAVVAIDTTKSPRARKPRAVAVDPPRRRLAIEAVEHVASAASLVGSALAASAFAASQAAR